MTKEEEVWLHVYAAMLTKGGVIWVLKCAPTN